MNLLQRLDQRGDEFLQRQKLGLIFFIPYSVLFGYFIVLYKGLLHLLGHKPIKDLVGVIDVGIRDRA
jgi:hypothetical protein